MHRSQLLPAAAAMAALALGPASSSAQESNSGTITAVGVVVSAITVTGTQDLDFGFLLRGVDRTLAATASAGGTFLVEGEPGAEVSLDFGTLPGTLDCVTASCGIETIPLVNPTAAWSLNGGGTTTAFTPPATAAGSHPALNGLGELEVYLGATAQPGAAQSAGTYEATITLTAAYTGN